MSNIDDIINDIYTIINYFEIKIKFYQTLFKNLKLINVKIIYKYVIYEKKIFIFLSIIIIIFVPP